MNYGGSKSFIVYVAGHTGFPEIGKETGRKMRFSYVSG